jgi:hypothetical protein
MGNSHHVVSWRVRTKMRLIEYKGGKCQRCGYNKPIPGAYDFHHRNPEHKDFQLSGKSINFETLKNEAEKCDLLCRTCHAEVHHEINEKRRAEQGLPAYLTKTSQCLNCNKTFVQTKWEQKYCTKECYHTIHKIKCKNCNKTIIKPQDDQKYCSHECMHFGRRKVQRPSKEELLLLINTNSLLGIGKMFGVSDNSVRKWCKSYGIAL